MSSLLRKQAEQPKRRPVIQPEAEPYDDVARHLETEDRDTGEIEQMVNHLEKESYALDEVVTQLHQRLELVIAENPKVNTNAQPTPDKVTYSKLGTGLSTILAKFKHQRSRIDVLIRDLAL